MKPLLGYILKNSKKTTKTIYVKYFNPRIFILFIGNLVTQTLIFLFGIIIAKLYSPSELGTYGVIIAICSYFAVSLTLASETFIIQDDEISAKIRFQLLIRKILRNSCYLLLIISLTAVILDTNFNKETKYFNIDVIIVIVMSSLLFAFQNLFGAVIQRSSNFALFAQRGVIQNASLGLGQISLHTPKIGYLGLIMGEWLGRIISLSWWVTRSLYLRSYFNGLFKNSTAKKDLMYKPWLKNYIASNLDQVISMSLILIMFYQFSAEIAGQFSLAQRLAAVPLSIFGASFSQYMLIYTSKLGREFNSIDVRYFDAICLKLGIAALMLSGSYSLVLANTFNLFFDAIWNPSMDIFILLVPWMILGLTWSPISTMFYSLKMYKTFFWITVFRASLVLVFCLAIIQLDFNLKMSILGITLIGIPIQIFGVILLRKKVSLSL